MDWIESNYSEQTTMRFARSGALVRIVCAEDACENCKSLLGRTYTPADAPRLPIRGCTNESCRCQFVAVDPKSNLATSAMIQEAVQAIRDKQADRARQTLLRAVLLDDMNEQAWLWLSDVVDDRAKFACLHKVLAINPRNKRAQAGLVYLEKLHPELAEEQIPVSEVLDLYVEPVSVEPEIEPVEVDIVPEQEPVDPPVSIEPEAQEEVSLPPAVIEAHEERQVIIEEWRDFMSFAIETDPQMVFMQGSAFLKQLTRLNTQALVAVGQVGQLAELERQWQESEDVGEPLADLLHDNSHTDTTNWPEMLSSLQQLAQRLINHRQSLRDQIKAAGGEIA